MTRVYINPTAKQVQDDNGVGRVVKAQYRYLPEHGIELVSRPDEAEVIASHINGDGLPRVDCLHLHGMYWTGDRDSGHYVRWHHDANKRIVEAARGARVITVPSEWVAMPFKRDMRLNPTVIGHGIELEDWEPGEPQGYALWNKNRASDVCDPTPAVELARSGLQVVSTFRTAEPPPEKLHTIGVQPFDKMKEWVRHASMYLATTKETFGIGTLEALAAGVPVLGFKWGGTADLITHKQDGYLVEPYDYDGLAEGAAYILAHHKEMRQIARETAKAYSWPSIMRAYARIYNLVAYEREQYRPTVAVVITNYNYGEWVGEAIESALNQTRPPDEVIVVDDGSTDRATYEAIIKYSSRIKVIWQENSGVAAARNAGIQAASSELIICLDADDRLLPDAIATLLPAFEDRALGVAYGNLNLLHPNGDTTDGNWIQPFSWARQAKVTNPPATCIPCASLFRRAMWERSGGYKQVYAPAEDAEFWTRGLSIGYTAKQVTTAPTFEYRLHAGSASRTKQYKPIDAYHPWMRDKQYPLAAPSTTPPLVRSYSEPLISVIIPVGPNHAQHLPAALDSLLGQTFREWEAIVINDSGQDIYNLLTVYPFIRTIDIGKGNGAGAARNEGISWAKAPLLLFLDADDYLDPNALASMVKAFAKHDRYVYSDWVYFDGKEAHIEESPPYDAGVWLDKMQHAVTALVPTEWALAVGGFDEDMEAWEDWEFFLKLAIHGYWGIHIKEPLLYYRYHTGTRREAAKAQSTELKRYVHSRYQDYLTGVKTMAGCCGSGGAAVMQAKQALRGLFTMEQEAESLASGATRLKYTGTNSGPISFRSKADPTIIYRGGQLAGSNYADVLPQHAALDVPMLTATGKWQVIREGSIGVTTNVSALSDTQATFIPSAPVEMVGNTLQVDLSAPPPLPEDELVPIPQTESGSLETAVPWFAESLSTVDGLTPRVLENLAAKGVHTLGDAVGRDDAELLAVEGIGPATLKLIREAQK